MTDAELKAIKKIEKKIFWLDVLLGVCIIILFMLGVVLYNSLKEGYFQ